MKPRDCQDRPEFVKGGCFRPAKAMVKMKTLYIDCGMGAAGDMLSAALLELLPDPEGTVKELNALGIPGVEYIREKSVKCGITGTHMRVCVNGEEEQEHSHDQEHHHEHEHPHEHEHHHEHNHHHSSLHEIGHVIEHLRLSEQVKQDITAVYTLIAEAESHVHGVPVADIHFHEVGTMDAVADIAAVCLLMEKLSVDEVIVSPVHVGSGQVRCAHGILGVPAPATAYILQGVPIYGGQIKGELCTPTGAALLKYFASSFGQMPVIRTEAIGYGMGRKDFEAANCVRAILGETEDRTDVVCELSCNVDDMTAEAIGFAMDCLFAGGALEVFTVPIGMKKSRPGTLIRVLCREEDRDGVLGLIFRHTTTIGVRETLTKRHVLERSVRAAETPWGTVRRKDSCGYGVSRSKYEYEDLARIAREQGLSLDEVRRKIRE